MRSAPPSASVATAALTSAGGQIEQRRLIGHPAEREQHAPAMRDDVVDPGQIGGAHRR